MSTRMKAIAFLGILTLSIFPINYPRSIQAFPKPQTSLSPANLSRLTQERAYKVRKDLIPDDVIEFVEVNNLNAADFPLSLEIVVKNVSAKNIYGVNLFIKFPDSNINGLNLGYSLNYGDKRLHDYRNRATPDEDFIPPGKTGIIKMARNKAASFIYAVEKGDIPLSSTYNVRIDFQTLNFGDGTGYFCKEPYPRKMSQIQKR